MDDKTILQVGGDDAIIFFGRIGYGCNGKTLEFLIPVVNQVIQGRRASTEKGGHSLDAIATKELSSQIVNEAKKLSLETGIKVVGIIMTC